MIEPTLVGIIIALLVRSWWRAILFTLGWCLTMITLSESIVEDTTEAVLEGVAVEIQRYHTGTCAAYGEGIEWSDLLLKGPYRANFQTGGSRTNAPANLKESASGFPVYGGSTREFPE